MTENVIAFTGHRNKITTEDNLTRISEMYPADWISGSWVWMEGGADGFDTQVKEYAVAHNITYIEVRPDYKKYYPRIAPLVRNRLMVDKCKILIACYDGRMTGGTKYTIDYAKEQGKEIVYVDAIPAPVKMIGVEDGRQCPLKKKS